jgi:hypothetical protein
MFEWLHHLLNPHCADCAHDKECKSCDTLREQLALANREKEHLLNRLLAPPAIETTSNEPITVKPRHVPWAVKQQMLEQEKRQEARILRELKNTEELEKELGVGNVESR